MADQHRVMSRTLKVCKLCKAPHTRHHSWCTECAAQRAAERAERNREAGRLRNAAARAAGLGDYWAPSRPPPPPPGFHESDLAVGRPFG